MQGTVLVLHAASFSACHQEDSSSLTDRATRAYGVLGRRNGHTEHRRAESIHTVEIGETLFHILDRISLCRSREVLSLGLSDV